MAGDHSAARRFEAERDTVVAAYAEALTDARSPLVDPGRWTRVRRSAEAILRDTAAGLRGEPVVFSDADLVTIELMGARRAVDGVPLRESLRAARLLWGVAVPALRGALAELPPPGRSRMLRTAGEAFRRSACTRLHIGASGYADPELRELLRGADSALSASEAESEAARAVVPPQRVYDARIPEGGAHHRIALELGIPESAVRSTLRAALRGSAVAQAAPAAPAAPHEHPADKTTEGQTAGGQTTERQRTEGQTVEGQTTERLSER